MHDVANTGTDDVHLLQISQYAATSVIPEGHFMLFGQHTDIEPLGNWLSAGKPESHVTCVFEPQSPQTPWLACKKTPKNEFQYKFLIRTITLDKSKE